MAKTAVARGTLRGATPYGFVDVRRAGAAGDGVTDDSAAINAAILAAPSGADVWFPGSFAVASGLRLRPDLRYRGAGGITGMSKVIAKAGLTGAVMAPIGWWDNQDSVGRFAVEGLQIDVTAAPGAHCLVAFGFWSHYRDIQFVGPNGATARGLLITDRCRNGTTVSTSSHSENKFEWLRFMDHTNSADAIEQVSANGYSNQDGHLRNCFFASIHGNAMTFGRIAGWSVVDNHLYGIGKNGISAQGGYATKIQDNYIEDWGQQNVAGQYYSAISLAQLDTRGSKIAGNTISPKSPGATINAARWTAIYVEAGWGQAFARVQIADNVIAFADTAQQAAFHGRCWAIDMNCNANGSPTPKLEVGFGTNLIDPSPWWGKRWNVHAQSSITPGYRAGAQALTGGNTLPLNCETSPSTVTWTPVAGTAAITVQTPTNAQEDGDTFSVTVLAGATARTVTLDSGMGRLTGITATYAVPINKKLRLLLRYSTGDSTWTVEAAAVQQ